MALHLLLHASTLSVPNYRLGTSDCRDEGGPIRSMAACREAATVLNLFPYTPTLDNANPNPALDPPYCYCEGSSESSCTVKFNPGGTNTGSCGYDSGGNTTSNIDFCLCFPGPAFGAGFLVVLFLIFAFGSIGLCYKHFQDEAQSPLRQFADHLGWFDAAHAKAQQSSSSSAAAVAPMPTMQEYISVRLQNIVSGDPAEVARLRAAASQLDVATVSSLLAGGLEMDAATADAAFWAVVAEVDRAEAADEALSPDVPRMLHHVFDADMVHLLRREKQTTNVTCMQPELKGIDGASHNIGYMMDDTTYVDMPLSEGRKCKAGRCCEACSRNVFPTFATAAETDLETFPDLSSITFNDLEHVGAASILQFVRLMERVRRTIAVEYGLPLHTVLMVQGYSRKYVAGMKQTGGGGSEGDSVTLHCDEATHSNYHYSCVVYLNTQGEDFEGGDFIFNDPIDPDDPDAALDGESYYAVQADADDDDDAGDEEEEVDDEVWVLADTDNYEEDDFGELSPEMAAMMAALNDDDDEGMFSEKELERERAKRRKLTPFHPVRGSAVVFSSGWENMHEVHKITSGTRYVVPCFFTTEPVPEAAYTQQMGAGKPKTDEDIADDWLHLLLAHRQESPQEAMGRVKELLMKWHFMCTPLSEHAG